MAFVRLLQHALIRSLNQLDPRPAVTEWLKRKEMRAKETPTAREQKWRRGIFKDANNAEDNEDVRDEEDSDKSQLKMRIF